MPAAPGAAIPAEGLLPGRDTECVTAQSCSCSLCLSMELGVDRSWRVLGQGSSPLCSPSTYITGQGADEGHEEGNQASLCLQALPILQGKNNSVYVITVPAMPTSSFPAHSGAPAPITNIHTPKGWKEEGKLFWGRKETSPSRKRGTT